MTEQTAEQVLTRVLGEHEYDHLSLSGCVCGWAQRAVGATWPSEHRAHVAAELAAALKGGGNE